jgi:hypothetical protein
MPVILWLKGFPMTKPFNWKYINKELEQDLDYPLDRYNSADASFNNSHSTRLNAFAIYQDGYGFDFSQKNWERSPFVNRVLRKTRINPNRARALADD